MSSVPNNESTPLFNPLTKSIVLCSLQDLLDKLDILKQLTNSYETKFHLSEGAVELVDLRDFQKDLDFIESTLKVTFEEIYSSGTYQQLLQLIDGFNKNKNDDVRLLEDTENKKIQYIDLQNFIKTEKEKIVEEIDECGKNIAIVKDQIEDFRNQGAIKSKYVQDWKNSEIQVCKNALIKKENELGQAIAEKELDLTREDRVHMEICNIYTELDDDLFKELNKWKKKYENDYNTLQGKIDALRDKRDQQRVKATSLETLFNKRQQEIDAFTKYKIQLELKRKELEKKRKASTKVQAWWRGTMVRKGLGKYKKKKDKKGKKKGESGEKKK